ncbi:hypothetical protein OF83DRAFT_432357 [Amylostereum chailletii]|nr:hypothetical protein OF83DRAFT_432357 [Amylostereum chailletii]
MKFPDSFAASTKPWTSSAEGLYILVHGWWSSILRWGPLGHASMARCTPVARHTPRSTRSGIRTVEGDLVGWLFIRNDHGSDTLHE